MLEWMNRSTIDLIGVDSRHSSSTINFNARIGGSNGSLLWFFIAPSTKYSSPVHLALDSSWHCALSLQLPCPAQNHFQDLQSYYIFILAFYRPSSGLPQYRLNHGLSNDFSDHDFDRWIPIDHSDLARQDFIGSISYSINLTSERRSWS